MVGYGLSWRRCEPRLWRALSDGSRTEGSAPWGSPSTHPWDRAARPQRLLAEVCL